MGSSEPDNKQTLQYGANAWDKKEENCRPIYLICKLFTKVIASRFVRLIDEKQFKKQVYYYSKTEELKFTVDKWKNGSTRKQ